MRRSLLIVLGLLIVVIQTAVGASLDKAKMLQLHGLTLEAKKELIEVIFSRQNAKNKAEAYYILGNIAFEEDKLPTALETWTELVKEFPESEQAQLVKDRISQLSESIIKVSRTQVENAVARFYLKNADFWSEDKSKVFTIYSDSLDIVENAIFWYDKVIEEFPKTTASRVAYEDKMRTLMGWKKTGAYRQPDRLYGIKLNFIKYEPQLVETFSAFERDHPEASSLQSFRYQIAQIYWARRNFDSATIWLRKIIEQSGGNYTFYRDLADRRLKTIESLNLPPSLELKKR